MGGRGTASARSPYRLGRGRGETTYNIIVCAHTRKRATTVRACLLLVVRTGRSGITVSPAAARTAQCCQPGSGGLAVWPPRRRTGVDGHDHHTAIRHTIAARADSPTLRQRRLVAARRRPTRPSTAGYRNFDKTANVTTTNGRFSVVPRPPSSRMVFARACGYATADETRTKVFETPSSAMCSVLCPAGRGSVRARRTCALSFFVRALGTYHATYSGTHLLDENIQTVFRGFLRRAVRNRSDFDFSYTRPRNSFRTSGLKKKIKKKTQTQ